MRWKRVLIETSWNVKINGKTKAAITIRINRNIVECKEFSFCGSFDCSDGINRNIVECKEQDAYNSRQDHTSINRNIVECKVLKVYTTYIRIFRINRNIVECKEILIDEFNNNMLHFMKVRV